MAERLQHVQHDEDEVGGASHGDNLVDGGVRKSDLEDVSGRITRRMCQEE